MMQNFYINGMLIITFLKRNVDNLDVGNSALYLFDMATGEIHYVEL